MNSDSEKPFRTILPPEQVIASRIFANLIFDSFVDTIVRDHYDIKYPQHVSFQVGDDGAMLFVKEANRAMISEDPGLGDWAIEFIATEILGIEPENVDLIYLDGVVGAQSAYLHVEGDGILIVGGKPMSGGVYL